MPKKLIPNKDVNSFQMDSPLNRIASKSNTEKEWVHDFQLNDRNAKVPPGHKINSMIHYVDKKTTNKPVKTDPSGNYMTPNTDFKTKPKLADPAPKTKKNSKSKPIDFKKGPAPKTNYKTKFVDDSKSETKKKQTTKKKVTFKEAYKNRSMKTYGNLTFDEYKAEAKRQIKHKKDTTVKETPGKKGKEGSWDAPKGQMKGGLKPSTKPKAKTVEKTTKNTLKPDPKNFETLDSAKAKRKSARKAVRTARKEFGRRSDEVKTAKSNRKAAKQKVKSVKKRDRGGERTLGGKLAYFLAGPSGRAKMDAKKSGKTTTAKTTTAKKSTKTVDLTKKSGKGPRA